MKWCIRLNFAASGAAEGHGWLWNELPPVVDEKFKFPTILIIMSCSIIQNKNNRTLSLCIFFLFSGIRWLFVFVSAIHGLLTYFLTERTCQYFDVYLPFSLYLSHCKFKFKSSIILSKNASFCILVYSFVMCFNIGNIIFGISLSTEWQLELQSISNVNKIAKLNS